MIDLPKIQSLGVGPELIAFTEFLIEEQGDRNFPNYLSLDLMKIPALVPYVWAYDYRNGIADGFLYHFTGTKIDEYIGFNAMGHTFEHCYRGVHQESLISEVHKRVYLERKIGFTLRHDEFTIGHVKKLTRVESLSFPCSEDDVHLDFGIGITNYTQEFEDFEPTFRIL